MPVEHCPECQRYVDSSRPEHAVTCSRLPLTQALGFLSIRAKQMADEEAVNRTTIRNLHDRIHGLEKSEQIAKTQAMAWHEEYDQVVRVVARELHGLVPKTHVIDSIAISCRLAHERAERSEAMRHRRDESEAALISLVRAVSEWCEAWRSSRQCDPSRDGSRECELRRATLDLKCTALAEIFERNALPLESLRLLKIQDAAMKWGRGQPTGSAEELLKTLAIEEG